MTPSIYLGSWAVESQAESHISTQAVEQEVELLNPEQSNAYEPSEKPSND